MPTAVTAPPGNFQPNRPAKLLANISPNPSITPLIKGRSKLIDREETSAKIRERVDRRLSNMESVAGGGRGTGPALGSRLVLVLVLAFGLESFSATRGEGTYVEAEFCFSYLLSEWSECEGIESEGYEESSASTSSQCWLWSKVATDCFGREKTRIE